MARQRRKWLGWACSDGTLLKLYAAMLVGLAIGTGIALVLAARELELEDVLHAETPTMPVTPANGPAMGA